MQREPPVPCANLHKSWLPATHAWTPKQLRKAFESKSVIRAPPPPPPSDPQCGLLPTEPDAQPRLTPNWPRAHRPQGPGRASAEPSRGTLGFEKRLQRNPTRQSENRILRMFT